MRLDIAVVAALLVLAGNVQPRVAAATVWEAALSGIGFEWEPAAAGPPVITPVAIAVSDDPALALVDSGVVAPVLPPPRPPEIPAAGKQVRIHTAATIWQGRNSDLFGRRGEAPPEQHLEFRDSAEGWLRVRTPRGVRGWIRGELATVLEGDTTYAVTDGEWTLAYRTGTPAAVHLTLQVPAPGVLRWTVETPGRDLGAPVARGDALLIPADLAEIPRYEFPVAAAGVRALALSQAGAELAMAGLSGWQVEEQTAGRIVLELRPRLTAVVHQALGDRTVYHFATAGAVLPRASAREDDLVVDIPGAVLAVPSLPPGLVAAASDSGVQVTLKTRQPYTLKRTEAGFALHVFSPGLAGKIILIDPGHGSDLDPGAANPNAGVVEKDANLRLAERVRRLLLDRGARVLMTRDADREAVPLEAYDMPYPDDELDFVDLGYRAYLANRLRVDLFLSIHHNANGVGGARGTETYYTPTTLNGPLSRQLARLVQEEVPGATGRPDRGAREEVFYVTRATDAPAALVEVAYVDHWEEATLINNPRFQEQAAVAMVAALERFYAGQ